MLSTSLLNNIKCFYRKLPPKSEPLIIDNEKRKKLMRRLQYETFFGAIVGHSLYYVCRTTLNVTKTPIVNEGILNDTQLGIIGSSLLFAYALGKFVNSFLTDYSNIKRFMATGLIISVLANFLVSVYGYSVTYLGLGASTFFISFALLWAINGWGQSMGTAPPIVSLSRWFNQQERGTFYGFFSAGHNIGEFLSFIIVGSIVSYIGWRQGFIAASIAGIIGIFVIIRFLHDSPESKGLPPIVKASSNSVKSAQKGTLCNRNVWLVAIASGFMYVSRYAVNGWGVRFLEVTKNYSLPVATTVIGINSMAAIAGAVFSGWISDHFFQSRRNIPALMYGVLNSIALALFLKCSSAIWINIVAMILFGFSVGGLICFLGGLMAVEFAPRNASGAAVGMVGLISYICAGLQDTTTGYLIDSYKVINTTGSITYNFTPVSIFWLCASVMSFLTALLVWNAKKKE